MSDIIKCRPGPVLFSLSPKLAAQMEAMRKAPATQPVKAAAPAARPQPEPSEGELLDKLAATIYSPKPSEPDQAQPQGQPASFAEIAAQAYRPAKRFTSGLSLGRMADHLNR